MRVYETLKPTSFSRGLFHEMTLMYIPSESFECSEGDSESKLHAVMDYLLQSNRAVYEDVLEHVKV